jgi:hypothetical protein
MSSVLSLFLARVIHLYCQDSLYIKTLRIYNLHKSMGPTFHELSFLELCVGVPPHDVSSRFLIGRVQAAICQEFLRMM